MERIDVFDYIDRACNELEANFAGFSHAADKLTEYLDATFGVLDATVGVTSRIKTRDSLKEKILRNNLYKQCEAERLVYEMHDIIGVRLECRFFKDEEFLFGKIRETFCVDLGDGFFSPSGKKAIKLKLDTPQPERQRNGFDIYRIDGVVTYASEDYNFELQIKSLVNTFWSEIEHKLIYKNIRFNPADSLLKELLNSIHDSLTGVDHQLNLIFDRLNGNSLESQQYALENMLTLGLSEVYTAIVKAKTGIDVGISAYAEAVVKYLLTASSYAREMHGESLKSIVASGVRGAATEAAVDYDDDDDDDDNNYSELLINLMQWMRTVDYSSIDIGGKIELSPAESQYPEVAKIFEENINSDFYLNTFFHIYFSLERGSDSDDFVDYINYYGNRILRGKTQEEYYRTLARLMDTPPHKLPLESTLQFLSSRDATEN